jgi:hypothetical protein
LSGFDGGCDSLVNPLFSKEELGEIEILKKIGNYQIRLQPHFSKAEVIVWGAIKNPLVTKNIFTH